MSHENPLRPDEREAYGTPVASPDQAPLEGKTREAGVAGTASSSSPWIFVGVGVLVVFLVLMVAAIVLAVR